MELYLGSRYHTLALPPSLLRTTSLVSGLQEIQDYIPPILAFLGTCIVYCRCLYAVFLPASCRKCCGKGVEGAALTEDSLAGPERGENVRENECLDQKWPSGSDSVPPLVAYLLLPTTPHHPAPHPTHSSPRPPPGPGPFLSLCNTVEGFGRQNRCEEGRDRGGPVANTPRKHTSSVLLIKNYFFKHGLEESAFLSFTVKRAFYPLRKEVCVYIEELETGV